MPPVNKPQRGMDGIAGLFKRPQDQINAMARQQNWGIHDGSLVLRVRGGLQDDGTYGVRTFDSDGNVRVEMGQLSNGDNGVLLLDPATNQNTELLPLYWAQLPGSVSATGSSFQDLGFPSETVTVGASGSVKITLSSQFLVPSNPGVQGGVVSVSLDGATPAGILAGLLACSASAGAAPGLSCSVTVVVTGLTPGAHTFKALFQADTSAGCSFVNTFAQYQPI